MALPFDQFKVVQKQPTTLNKGGARHALFPR